MIAGQKKVKYFYGKTKKEVLEKISAFREEQSTGRLFSVVADEWWEEHEKDLAANTKKQYRPALARLKTAFGSTPIRQLRPPHVNRFLQEQARTHHWAQKTAKTQLMVANLICSYAVKMGDCDYNPARELEVPKGLTKKERQMPSDEDIKRIKTSRGCTFGDFAYWLLYTGLRRSELLALTWEDVDMEAREITVNKSIYQVNNKVYVKPPKTEKGNRIVPLLDRLAAVITPGTGLIFPDYKTGGYINENHFQTLWEKYRRESGVSCTPHQLRHAFATMCFEADIDESDLQYILGHAQISTTKDIYTQIRKQRREKVQAKILGIDLE